MAPKKKGNKKQDDDWEAELGEAAPGAGGEAEAEANPDEPAGEDGEAAGAGGLLAALRKNKNKKAKKGKPANDYIEGEDPTEGADGAGGGVDPDSKKPEEGNLEDEDDVFAGKSQKSAKAAAAAVKAQQAEDQVPDGDGFRVKSKKEKEKEKKEREKQRKKEQVRIRLSFLLCFLDFSELICIVI